jgi:hypothetical protein
MDQLEQMVLEDTLVKWVQLAPKGRKVKLDL